MTKILVNREVIHAAIDALESVERLIEHQYTGTREGMAYLQDTVDDAQVMLGELQALLDQPDAPKVEEPLPPIYYMRDNHTFKKLSEDVTTALVEIEEEFNAGYTYGSLYSKRDGFRQVHAQGENLRMFFLNACRESLESKGQP